LNTNHEIESVNNYTYEDKPEGKLNFIISFDVIGTGLLSSSYFPM